MKMHYDDRLQCAGEVVGIEVLYVKRRVPSADLKALKFEVASAGGA